MASIDTLVDSTREIAPGIPPPTFNWFYECEKERILKSIYQFIMGYDHAEGNYYNIELIPDILRVICNYIIKEKKHIYMKRYNTSSLVCVHERYLQHFGIYNPECDGEGVISKLVFINLDTKCIIIDMYIAIPKVLTDRCTLILQEIFNLVNAIYYNDLLEYLKIARRKILSNTQIYMIYLVMYQNNQALQNQSCNRDAYFTEAFRLPDLNEQIWMVLINARCPEISMEQRICRLFHHRSLRLMQDFLQYLHMHNFDFMTLSPVVRVWLSSYRDTGIDFGIAADVTDEYIKEYTQLLFTKLGDLAMVDNITKSPGTIAAYYRFCIHYQNDITHFGIDSLVDYIRDLCSLHNNPYCHTFQYQGNFLGPF